MAKPRSVPAGEFEQAMAELEALVAKLERGDLPLEESLAAFERGVALTRTCQTALAAAEQKVEMLSRTGDGDSEAVPFAGTAALDDTD